MKLLALLCAAVALAGCSTIKPAEVTREEPSWDEGAQTSGEVYYDPANGMNVTPKWRARYNSLIAAYGDKFKPALVKDEGVTPGAPGVDHCWANHFARVHFFVMNRWETSQMHQPPSALKAFGGQ